MEQVLTQKNLNELLTTYGSSEKEAIPATIIMMALDHDHILEIGDKLSPKDIFQHLTRMYEDQTTFQIGTIFSEIDSFKINSDSKLQEMFSRLRGAGAKVDVQYRISAIGLSLPSEFKNILDQCELSCKGKTAYDFLSKTKYYRNRFNKQSIDYSENAAFDAYSNIRYQNRNNRQTQDNNNEVMKIPKKSNTMSQSRVL